MDNNHHFMSAWHLQCISATRATFVDLSMLFQMACILGINSSSLARNLRNKKIFGKNAGNKKCIQIPNFSAGKRNWFPRQTPLERGRLGLQKTHGSWVAIADAHRSKSGDCCGKRGGKEGGSKAGCGGWESKSKTKHRLQESTVHRVQQKMCLRAGSRSRCTPKKSQALPHGFLFGVIRYGLCS